MKTLRITILAAALAATVYSCSTDREDEVNPTAPAAAKLELKPLKKENNQGNTSTAREGDTVKVRTTMLPTNPTDPIDPTDPNEGGDPKNLPPRN